MYALGGVSFQRREMVPHPVPRRRVSDRLTAPWFRMMSLMISVVPFVVPYRPVEN